jgi:hypothetical protein
LKKLWSISIGKNPLRYIPRELSHIKLINKHYII